jgi:hypothetical protein
MRKCVECGRDFDPRGSDTDTCTPCLLRPIKISDGGSVAGDIPLVGPIDNKKITVKTGEKIMQNCKEKKCEDCGETYKPASNVQRRCPKCAAVKHVTHKVKPKPVDGQVPAAEPRPKRTYVTRRQAPVEAVMSAVNNVVAVKPGFGRAETIAMLLPHIVAVETENCRITFSSKQLI